MFTCIVTVGTFLSRACDSPVDGPFHDSEFLSKTFLSIRRRRNSRKSAFIIIGVSRQRRPPQSPSSTLLSPFHSGLFIPAFFPVLRTHFGVCDCVVAVAFDLVPLLSSRFLFLFRSFVISVSRTTKDPRRDRRRPSQVAKARRPRSEGKRENRLVERKKEIARELTELTDRKKRTVSKYSQRD